MKKYLVLFLCFILLGCQSKEIKTEESLIHESGETLETRIDTPKGYHPIQSDDSSLTTFLRQYPLKPHGSHVLLYNGKEKRNQSAHVGIFQLPIENADLQQCADSIMRVYAEYYYHRKEYDRISFQFVNGFHAEYSKWRKGYSIVVDNQGARWVKSSSDHTSYQSFQKYMRMVFAYASTRSMDKESKSIQPSQIQVGDVFLKAGSPGHVVMIVNVCENNEGKKAFLLAQGYMPAQEFHILKNNQHEDDPWYYEEDISYPFHTPEYTFQEGSLRRLQYGEE